jgi:uncharacterized protein YbgA (DUF1722 family)
MNSEPIDLMNGDTEECKSFREIVLNMFKLKDKFGSPILKEIDNDIDKINDKKEQNKFIKDLFKEFSYLTHDRKPGTDEAIIIVHVYEYLMNKLTEEEREEIELGDEILLVNNKNLTVSQKYCDMIVNRLKDNASIDLLNDKTTDGEKFSQVIAETKQLEDKFCPPIFKQIDEDINKIIDKKEQYQFIKDLFEEFYELVQKRKKGSDKGIIIVSIHEYLKSKLVKEDVQKIEWYNHDAKELKLSKKYYDMICAAI